MYVMQILSSNKESVFMLHPMIGSVTAIIAGIIILIYPSILNYVVAIYLILTGLIGIFGT